MPLREWMGALNGAGSEEELARVMGDFVKQVRSASHLPGEYMPREPVNAEDIRREAEFLTRLQVPHGVANADLDFYQQLMILFSLAVDRLSMLEGRGIIARNRPAWGHSAAH